MAPIKLCETIAIVCDTVFFVKAFHLHLQLKNPFIVLSLFSSQNFTFYNSV